MYQYVSLGSDFFVVTPGESRSRRRLGHEVATQLLTTLSTNPRTASLVKELHLAIRDAQRDEALEYTRMNVRILQICQNVTHVEIRGFHHTQSDALAEALKAKSDSLVSLCITQRMLSTSNIQGSSFNLLEIMQRLPKLRILKAEGLLALAERNALDAPNCCPDLREVRIVDCELRYSDLEFLSLTSAGVKHLSIILKSWSSSEAVRDALCECLRVWSLTLEHLNLEITGRQIMSYRPFLEALSTLKVLQELEVNGSLSGFGAIADLPSLQRLSFESDEDMSRFAAHLDDPMKFPALKYVVAGSQFEMRDKKLHDTCLRRGIDLEEWWRDDCIPGCLSW